MNKVKWQPDLCNNYKNTVSTSDIEGVMSYLDTHTDWCADDINAVNEQVNTILLNPAKKLGILKNTNKRGANTKGHTINNKPWFNCECKTARGEYVKCKNRYKKN